MVSGKLVNQFGTIKPTGSKPKVTLERKEAIDSLSPGYSIQIPTTNQRHQAMGEHLKVSGHLASGTPHPLGYCLNLTQVWGIERKDSTRLPQLSLLNDNSLSLVIPWLGHLFNALNGPVLERLPALQRSGQGDIVGVFQFGAEGESPGKASNLDAQGWNQVV